MNVYSELHFFFLSGKRVKSLPFQSHCLKRKFPIFLWIVMFEKSISVPESPRVSPFASSNVPFLLRSPPFSLSLFSSAFLYFLSPLSPPQFPLCSSVQYLLSLGQSSLQTLPLYFRFLRPYSPPQTLFCFLPTTTPHFPLPLDEREGRRGLEKQVEGVRFFEGRERKRKSREEGLNLCHHVLSGNLLVVTF